MKRFKMLPLISSQALALSLFPLHNKQHFHVQSPTVIPVWYTCSSVDSISADKRRDTFIGIAGLVVVVHKPELWRHTISHPFTICFGGGTWVALSDSRNRRRQVLLHFMEYAGSIRKNYEISLNETKILKSHLSLLVPPSTSAFSY
jgi:hypothetical protein